MSGWWGLFTVTESLVETNEPTETGQAVDNEHFKVNSHFSLFISLQYTAHLLFSEPLLIPSHSHMRKLIDLHLEDKRMDIIFPTEWGRQDQYSHCWLSFCNLYNIGPDRSLSHNCLHFRIKYFFPFHMCQWHLEWLPVLLQYTTLWSTQSKGHKTQIH